MSVRLPDNKVNMVGVARTICNNPKYTHMYNGMIFCLALGA